MPDKPEVRTCGKSIDGPKVGRHVVLWRRYCKNKTSHPSGLCHVHRDPGWYVGKSYKEEK
jgi:hypothetical protein